MQHWISIIAWYPLFCSGCSFGPRFQAGTKDDATDIGSVDTTESTHTATTGSSPIAEPTKPLCGNGVVDTNEECDGSQTCSVDCLEVACGNGRLEEGEECDAPGTETCNDNCQLIACGNQRLDPTEECEPPGNGPCSAECRWIQCNNHRIDPGETCDPPLPGACDSRCQLIACGNGVVDEGEGCDPPELGVCSSECRPEGCGDGQIAAGEECDPPRAGACDGKCMRIECGNGRLDDGEECEPPQTNTCDGTCHSIECGNGRVDSGEQCDPPAWSQCSGTCQRVVCGDGRVDPGEQCEPTSPTDPTCSSQCGTIDSTGREYLYTFDADLQGWALYATSPERLAFGTHVRFDSQNGNVSPGAVRLEAPFDGSNQKIEVQVSFDPIDMRGRTIVARVRLGSGLSSDPLNPGGIKLFAKAGSSFNYASGAWTPLSSGQGWQEVTLDCDEPILVPNEFDASQVRQIGVELRTFAETTQVSPAVVYLDAVSY